MIKHIVMFSFTDKVNDGNREEVKGIITDSVNKMKNAGIDGLLKMEPIFNITGNTPDLGLYCEFESVEALNGYQTHPDHERHKTVTKDYCKDRIVFDWE